MKKVNFYKTKSGKSPIEEFLNSLNAKQAQKVIWVLQIIEEFPLYRKNILKSWLIQLKFGKLELARGRIFLGYLDFLMGKKCLF
jgi:hypothetical protein